jgi:poly-gamma-glutamate synthesis protein (capsule biosynthesis protein)
MKITAYLAVGIPAFLGGWLAIVMAVHPRDRAAERAEPIAVDRPAAHANEATLLFAGDTAEVDEALPLLEKKGHEHPFGDTVELVREADLAVANLEAPITDGGRRFPLWDPYVYRAPSGSAAALAWAGFDVLSLANNHVLDYGSEGLADTIAHAGRAGLITVGAGRDPAEARRGIVARIGGVRVGLLSYCEDQIAWRIYVDLFARARHPGVAMLDPDDLARDLERLRARADVVVVLLHAGDNYAPPRPSTEKWGERAIDLGADLVVITHPHVAHPLHLYKGKPILLSLGNYAFGTPGTSALDWGWLALAHLTGRAPETRIDRVELIPLAVQNRRVYFRPQLLDGAELERALTRMRDQSAEWGANLRVSLEGRGRVILELAR